MWGDAEWSWSKTCAQRRGCVRRVVVVCAASWLCAPRRGCVRRVVVVCAASWLCAPRRGCVLRARASRYLHQYSNGCLSIPPGPRLGSSLADPTIRFGFELHSMTLWEPMRHRAHQSACFKEEKITVTHPPPDGLHWEPDGCLCEKALVSLRHLGCVYRTHSGLTGQ
ncbi:hypothetical protein PYCCODRAFT_91354 [Trametes coccinea BRFM310]|uniref:Uncharacterized protein n=1 Tax=Trametes coccinea (strain BRFM310) TaxID=1353009 RepID=A0A1Y2I5D6_TRAC3|nr:hypothetical protein PYCCODRAFT_91354 [Trametes coccinea BRFM310]